MRGFRDSSSVAKGVDFRDSTSVAKETRYVVLCALLSLRGIFVKKGIRRLVLLLDETKFAFRDIFWVRSPCPGLERGVL